MTAAGNMMAAMDFPHICEAQRILGLVNLHDLADRKPAGLSGDQRQRVAVAHALGRRPKTLLLDEPFSAIDCSTREKLYAEVIALRSQLKIPIALVTHDFNAAYPHLQSEYTAHPPPSGLARHGS